MVQTFRVGIFSGPALILYGAFAGVAFAGAVDDYEKGYEAYHRDDVMTAMHFLRRAADQGHAPSQALLGYILDRAEENEAAFVLYDKAARLGNADGMYGLGVLYLNGEGVEQSNELAVTWITRAAEAGHDVATMVLAKAYLDGGLGLSLDRERAVEWLERGAERGYEPARERLSRVLATQ
jgi:TPR repeat protein